MCSIINVIVLLVGLSLTSSIFAENCGLACNKWKMASLNETIDYRQNIPFRACFKSSSELYRVPEPLLASVAAGESDFNSRAVSASNAIGLMQIKWPLTAQHLGVNNRELLFNPCLNVGLGAKYLRELLTRYSNSIHHALAAYYYGPSRVPVFGKIPPIASRYSMYIFDRYINLFSSSEHIELISSKEIDSATSKLSWINGLNFEKSRLDSIKRQAVKSSSKAREYFRTRYSAQEPS